MKEKMKKKKTKKKRGEKEMKRDRDERREIEMKREERGNNFVERCLNQKNLPDEMSHNDSKKISPWTNYSFESSESYSCFQFFT